MKIAVLDDWAGVARDSADWDRLGGDVTVFTDPIPRDDLVATLAPFDVLCLMRERTPIPADLLAALPRLRLIVTTGARNSSVAVEAAHARNIVVSGTQSRKTTTAELTLAMMLHQSRRIGRESARLAQGGFQGPPGRDLAGLRIGLVGLGSIGGQIAALVRALGSTVSAWSPNLDPDRARKSQVTAASSLADLAANSDVLSIHMVLSDRSRGLVGRAAFDALPGDALVINTSRAGLLDRDALFRWLGDNDAAEAAIDVFEEEPLPRDDPWRRAKERFGDRLLLTPHIGYVTQATWAQFYEQTVEAIAAFQSGAPIRVI